MQPALRRVFSRIMLDTELDIAVTTIGKVLILSHQHTALRVPSKSSTPAPLATRPPIAPRICCRLQRPAPRTRVAVRPPIRLQTRSSHAVAAHNSRELTLLHQPQSPLGVRCSEAGFLRQPFTCNLQYPRSLTLKSGPFLPHSALVYQTVPLELPIKNGN